jgi:site-specific recombinase XerD
VDRYLAVHRPVLLGGAETTRLWVATGGRPLAEFSLYDAIRRLSQRLLGIALSPHRFRDALATTQAVEDAAHVLVASRLLDHGDVRTTNRAYNQSRMVQALDALYDVFDELQDEEPA